MFMAGGTVIYSESLSLLKELAGSINAQEEHAQGGRGEGGMCRLIK